MSDKLAQPRGGGVGGGGQNPLYFHPCSETNKDFVLETRGLSKQKKGVCVGLAAGQRRGLLSYHLGFKGTPGGAVESSSSIR